MMDTETRNAILARSLNTYVATILDGDAEIERTVYAHAIDIAARKARRAHGVVVAIRRTHVKGRPVAA